MKLNDVGVVDAVADRPRHGRGAFAGFFLGPPHGDFDTRLADFPALRTGRPEDYERQWRKVTRASRILTAGLLWARHTPPLAPRIVPAAARLPRTFTSLVNHVADA